MEAAQKPLANYLALFRQHHLGLLKRGQPGTDYPYTVATTWEIAFQRLEQESPAGAALLQLCAFFAPDDIPREMIVAGAEFLPDRLRETVSDELALDDALLAIRRYSFMEIGEDSALSMHRLVQAVIHDRLELPERKGCAHAALRVITEAFPKQSGEVRTWKVCNRLLPHATAVTDFAEPLTVGLSGMANLLNRIGGYARGRAEYKKAKAAYERALRLGEAAFGPDHSTIATFINNLGNVLQDLSDFPAAKAAYERALKIDEAAFGPESPEVATDINNLAVVLQNLGDLWGAKRLLNERLKLMKLLMALSILPWGSSS